MNNISRNEYASNVTRNIDILANNVVSWDIEDSLPASEVMQDSFDRIVALIKFGNYFYVGFPSFEEFFSKHHWLTETFEMPSVEQRDIVKALLHESFASALRCEIRECDQYNDLAHQAHNVGNWSEYDIDNWFTYLKDEVMVESHFPIDYWFKWDVALYGLDDEQISTEPYGYDDFLYVHTSNKVSDLLQASFKAFVDGRHLATSAKLFNQALSEHENCDDLDDIEEYMRFYVPKFRQQTYFVWREFVSTIGKE